MDAGDINYAARDIASRMHREMRAGRLARVDFDSIRCAVAGWLSGSNNHPTKQQHDDLENLAFRKFVEACA